MSTGMESVTIHCHIPKTAGTTLNSVLVDHFSGANCYAYRGDNFGPFIQQPVEQREAVDLVYGHCRYGIHRFLREPHTYLFILREPKARIFSFYKYVSVRQEHPLFPLVGAKKIPFGEFLQLSLTNRDIMAEINNGQVAILSGASRFSETPKQEMFRAACHNAFAKNAIVGLTEHSDLFFRELLDRQIISRLPDKKMNTTESSTTLAENLDRLNKDQSALLKNYCHFDDALYSACRTATIC